MADLVMASLITGIRQFCGNPLGAEMSAVDAEVTDANIQEYVGWAVRDICRSVQGKKIKVSYLETVADVQSYTPVESAEEIIEVHYGGVGGEDSLFSTSIYGSIFYDSPITGAAFGDRSVSLINEMHERELVRHSRFGKTWDLIEGKIYLIPTPSESGVKVYYEYIEDSAALTELDDTYTRLIYLKASTYVYSQMIGSRSSSAQAGTSGYQNTLNLGNVFALKEANEKEFLRELQKITTRRMVG
jgi:hypothetical protein